ncbi:hypothetical protein [Sphingopyxis sp.]|uniref:hypothetical protein n=1 Tax=Sphingopyxis sp. TaxID=1908224 RepID=UPI0025EE7F6D|nr:hypothetical protein [Sphingopyxis sp.]
MRHISFRAAFCADSLDQRARKLLDRQRIGARRDDQLAQLPLLLRFERLCLVGERLSSASKSRGLRIVCPSV